METIIGKEFPQKVIPLIDQSKTSIDTVVFDWRWYPQDPASPVQLFNQSLVRAVRRGVQLRAIANNDEIVRTLQSVGAKAKRLTVPNLVHCKLMIIDNAVAIVGSHNYTQNAFQMNYELSLIIDDKLTVDRIKNFFNNIYG